MMFENPKIVSVDTVFQLDNLHLHDLFKFELNIKVDDYISKWYTQPKSTKGVF